MITIRDIYQWCDNSYENAPHPPRDLNLTPLQLLDWEKDWEKQNAKAVEDYKNISFVGEKIIATALIESISIDKIFASATYSNRLGVYYMKHDLIIKYPLLFDQTLYETVKQIYNNSWVEFEGEIISFEYFTTEGSSDGYSSPKRIYNLKIKLYRIKVISKPSLSPSLLGAKSIPNQTHNSSKCFIATAAFGNQDIIEVIQLRAFRDNVLRNSLVGRYFISTYCILSPPIALVIRQSNWLRKVTRLFLRKVVLPLTKLRTNHLGK